MYSLTSYASWRKELNNWFVLNKEDQKIKNTIKSFNKEYYLDAEKIFPVYFQNQRSFLFSSNQLKTWQLLI
ncbi:hypothetical protein [Pedobacter sp. NJ-S-72]